jgi:ubiquinone/menaquinone biosynthesis C-methylase UbiE
VVDLADAGLRAAQERLGERSAMAEWVVGDVTTQLFPDRSIDFWHDRAVFHFLTQDAARAAYLTQVSRSVKPGGMSSLRPSVSTDRNSAAAFRLLATTPRGFTRSSGLRSREWAVPPSGT